MARQWGQLEHHQWQADMRAAAEQVGLVEGKDFDIEKSLPHPDGGPGVRYDYVDYVGHKIIDMKPMEYDGSMTELLAKYQSQRERHLQAYQAAYGVTPNYEYVPYAGVKEIVKEGQGKGNHIEHFKLKL